MRILSSPLFVLSSLSLASFITPATRDFIRACKDGDLDTAKLLMGRSDVDPQAHDGLALRLATAMGRANIVHLLMSPRRTPYSENVMEIDDKTVAQSPQKKLRMAEEPSQKRCRMLSSDVDDETTEMPPQKKHRVSTMLDLSENPQESLVLACAKGNLELVRELMTGSQVDPAAQDMEALVLAVKSGNVDLVKFLLASGRVSAAPDQCDALAVAAHFKAYKMIDILMGHETFVADYAFGVLRRQLCNHEDRSYLYEVYRHIIEHSSIELFQKLVQTARDNQLWLFKIIVLKGEPMCESDMRIFLDIHTDNTEVMQLMLLHPFVDVEHYFTLACKRGLFHLAEDALESGRLDLELALDPALTAVIRTAHTSITAWLLAIAKEKVPQEIAQPVINKACSLSCLEYCNPNGEVEHFKIFMDWNLPDAYVLKNLLITTTQTLLRRRSEYDLSFLDRIRHAILETMCSPNFDGVLSFSSFMMTKALIMNECDLVDAFWSHDAMKAHVFIDLFHHWLLGAVNDDKGKPKSRWSPFLPRIAEVSTLPIWHSAASDKDIIQSLFFDRVMVLPSIYGHFKEQLDRLVTRELSIDMIYDEFETMRYHGEFGSTMMGPVSNDRLRIPRLLQNVIAIHAMGSAFTEHGIPKELCQHILMDVLVEVLRDIRKEDTERKPGFCQ